MKDDYSITVDLLCPICGSDQFDYDEADDNSPVTCNSCKQTFSREELQEYNQDLIDNAIEDISDEFKKDFTNDLNKIFKKI